MSLPGAKSVYADSSRLSDFDRKVLAARGVDAMLKMILVDGFFQADPHPGNVIWLPGNRIVLIAHD
jgi:ubiquinone biosynthesis protein